MLLKGRRGRSTTDLRRKVVSILLAYEQAAGKLPDLAQFLRLNTLFAGTSLLVGSSPMVGALNGLNALLDTHASVLVGLARRRITRREMVAELRCRMTGRPSPVIELRHRIENILRHTPRT